MYMLRMGFFLNVILICISAGLLVTGDLKDSNGAFHNLSSVLGQVNNSVDANATITPINQSIFVSNFIFIDVVNLINFGGWLLSIFINIIALSVFLLTGYIQIANLIDPSHTFSFLIIAPLAIFQIFYVGFILIQITSSLLGRR